jgi:2-C-methyl-D-erythritol 4-phosphate cytidylyltransferase/2-C-methyl-D-erythritol 2,4-cyclodiphosphate synthase
MAVFAVHPEIQAIGVVINPDDRAHYDAAAESLADAGSKLLPPTAGGAERQDSVRLGLEALAHLSPENVLIHDGARPFISTAAISRVIEALRNAPAAIAALPLADTLKRQRSDRQNPMVESTVARENLWQAQTPQGFHFTDILTAHRSTAGASLTDDAAVAERAGLEVALVEGDPENFKITHERDLVRAERLFATGLSEIRVGQGFDVHSFGPAPADHHIMLCGIKVPHTQAVIGHSDADVGLHALTDAVLGAIGAGDIGEHFPPSDEKWKGASSDRFLAHAAQLVAKRGGNVVHVDLTLICERPKIGPLREAMRQRIARILALPVARVSVKATTTERLGFTGRGEGIAAQAVATVRLPQG